MKKPETKVMGKIGMEIAKLAIIWMAVIPWADDLLKTSWHWNETIADVALVTAVTFVGYFTICKVKACMEELKLMKEERKNSKKQRGAKAASPVSFCLIFAGARGPL